MSKVRFSLQNAVASSVTASCQYNKMNMMTIEQVKRVESTIYIANTKYFKAAFMKKRLPSLSLVNYKVKKSVAAAIAKLDVNITTRNLPLRS